MFKRFCHIFIARLSHSFPDYSLHQKHFLCLWSYSKDNQGSILSNSFEAACAFLFTYFLVLFLKKKQKRVFQKLSASCTSIAKKYLDAVFSGAEHGTTTTREASCRQLCSHYVDLHGEAKVSFLTFLSINYSANQEDVTARAKSLLEIQDAAKQLHLQEKLREALTPKYITIFHEIGRFEGGVKFLVDMRTDILDLLSALELGSDAVYHAKALNTSMKNLLALWFSVGFMKLQRITWESSCNMLQKISDYEAVHPIRNWTDLKRRVGMYRRCCVFTHSSMPLEPIVVLHTALMDEISSSIQSIVSYQRQHSEGDITLQKKVQRKEDPRKVKAAVFYSITSTQRGLIGIELGNYLIKQVVREVQKEFPLLTEFSSLSPIPGFKDWLLGELHKIEKGQADGSSILKEEEKAELIKHLNVSNDSFWPSLRKTVSKNWWAQDVLMQPLLMDPLMRSCAHYLYREKRRGYALNSVANFHLKNGAVMWRLNWKADWSPRGLANSCGIMVNYRYYLDETEQNSERYLTEQFIKSPSLFTKYLPSDLN